MKKPRLDPKLAHSSFIIDSHTHFGEDPTGHFPNSTRKSLLEGMDEAGIKMSCVMPFTFPTGKYLYKTSLECIEFAKDYSDRIIPFACVNPMKGDEALSELKDLLSKSARGLKLHPNAFGHTPNHPMVKPLIKACLDAGVNVIVTHTGGTDLALPFLASELAREFPDINLILFHSGYHMQRPESKIVAKRYKNLYLETANAAGPYSLKRMVEDVGADKIVFGSDAGCTRPLFEVIRILLSDLEPEDEEKILEKNMRRILKL